MKSNFIPEDAIKGARKWWNSLSAAKRRYLLEHCRLQDEKRRVRYYLNAIKGN